MKFKTDKEEQEHTQLLVKNPKLAGVLNAIDLYCSLEFGRDITITEIFRTPEETAALYAATPVEQRPTHKPHEKWEAADLRSWVFTDEQISKIVTFANCFTYKQGQRSVAIYHAIRGNTSHMHIQCGEGPESDA